MQPEDSVAFVEYLRRAVLAALTAPLTFVDRRHLADALRRLGDEQARYAELEEASATGGDR